MTTTETQASKSPADDRAGHEAPAGSGISRPGGEAPGVSGMSQGKEDEDMLAVATKTDQGKAQEAPGERIVSPDPLGRREWPVE